MDRLHLLADSLLHDGNANVPSFDVLFSEFLLENTKIGHYDSSFFVHLYLGLATIFASKQGIAKFNIDRSFYAWYEEFNMVKLIILTNDKKMRVRTLYLGKVETDMPRLLTKSEFEHLGHLIDSYELKSWAYSIYKDDLKLHKIDLSTTFAGFLSKYMVDIGYGVHDRKVLEDYLKSQREALSEYKMDVREYILQRSKIGSGRLFTIRGIYDEKILMRNVKMLGLIGKADSKSDTMQVDFERNTLAIIDGISFACGEEWSDVLSQNFLAIYDEGSRGNAEAFRSLLEKTSQIYFLATAVLGYPADKSEARESGFTLGLLLGLNSVNPVVNQIRLTQYIPSDERIEDYDNINELTSYMLIFEPMDILKQEQIVISFSTEKPTARALEECQLKKSIINSYLLMSIDLLDDDCLISEELMPNRNALVPKMLSKDHNSLKKFLGNVLDSLQSTALVYEESQVNYLSRFFLGYFASIKENGYEIYEMRPKTMSQKPIISYLLKSPKKNFVILNFLNDRGRFYPRTSAHCDTNIVNIVQNVEQDNDGYIKIKRSINVQRSNFDMMSSEYDLQKIDSLSPDLLRLSPDLFTEHLTSFLQTFRHLLDTPHSSTLCFKAVLDGLFVGERYAENVVPLKNRLSTVQYTFLKNAEGMEEHASFLDNEVLQRRELSNKAYITINFKYKYEEENADHGLEAMLDMLKSAKEDHEHLNIVINNGDRLRGTLHTENDLLRECNIVRKKRHGMQSCIDILIKKKRLEDVEDVPKKTVQEITVLKDIANLANLAMMGLMLRDLVTDIVHGEKLAVAKDAGFLATTILSPKIGELLAEKSEVLLTKSALFSGYATKVLSFGVSRAISLYILEDFLSNTVKYVKNSKDKSSGVGMAVDGAFLTIDAVTIGVESLASASVAAITTPIGAIVGAVIIIGLNVYQAVEQVEHIDHIIKLDDQETIDESLRALLHLDPATNIKYLMDEKLANQEIAKNGIAWLASHNEYDTIVLRAGELQNHEMKLRPSARIDFREKSVIKVSRASPEGTNGYNIECPLNLEKDEIQPARWWNKVEEFFIDASSFFTLFKAYFTGNKVQTLQSLAHLQKHSYETRAYQCHNAFAVQKYDASTVKSAFFQLGAGADTVFGFRYKSNVFYIGQGLKFVKGGFFDDKFILQSSRLQGILDGGAGFDTMDMSICGSTEWPIKGANITFQNFEEFIFAKNTAESITCFCEMRRVQSRGGNSSHPDIIRIPNSDECFYNLTFFLQGYTDIDNQAENGKFTYLVDVDEDTKIRINTLKANHTLHIRESLLNLQKLNFSKNDNETFSIGLQFIKFEEVITIVTYHRTDFRIIFTDNCSILINNTMPIITMYTIKTMEDIIRTYSDKVKQLSTSFIVYSSSDNESMIFAHGIMNNNHLHVIHNTLEHESNLILNDQSKNLLLMNGSMESGALKFPRITLHCHFAKLTVDFNLLIDQMPKSNLYLNARTEAHHIIMTAYEENQDGIVVNSIGEILIVDAFINLSDQNIKIQSYNKLEVYQILPAAMNSSQLATNISWIAKTSKFDDPIERYLQNKLEPTIMTYNENYNLILISQSNVEWFQILFINASVDHLEFYHVNHTSLVLTNVADIASYDTENLCTIFVENFFHWLKLQSLVIKSRYQEWSFVLRSDEIKSARGIDVLQKLASKYA